MRRAGLAPRPAPAQRSATVAGLACVILAAGRSRRFGGRKLLAELARGTPLIVQTVARYRAVFPVVWVVVGHRDAALSQCLKSWPGVRLVPCTAAARGLAHSLGCGLRAAGRASGYVIGLGDMPWVPVNTIRQVAAALQHGAAIAAPYWQGRRGHPVGFQRTCLPQLLRLRGEQAGRAILRRHGEQVVLVPGAGPEIHTDVDRRMDLVRRRMDHRHRM